MNRINSRSEADVMHTEVQETLDRAGWTKEHRRFEYFLSNEGKVGKAEHVKNYRADCVLFMEGYKPIAVIEGKAPHVSAHKAVDQAVKYAKLLGAPFAYSTNGKELIEHEVQDDGMTGASKSMRLEDFPSREKLIARYWTVKRFTDEQRQIVGSKYRTLNNGMIPRYYQYVSVNKTMEAIARGEKRMMLVMATGVGKTFTSFQIVHRALESKVAKKVLFLADRTMLIHQTYSQDFSPFNDSSERMEIVKRGKFNTEKSIFLALYQGISKEESVASEKENALETRKRFLSLDKDFFDLVIIDECHRGAVNKNSEWREILDHFSSAIHVGLTATPRTKEHENGNNLDYFGEPIFTYSLRNGVDDGYLSPFQVIRYRLSSDVNGIYHAGKRISSKEIDKSVVLLDRHREVAKVITDYLKLTENRFQKTILFCKNIDHARLMREALEEQNRDMKNPDKTGFRYVEQLTGDIEDKDAILSRFKKSDSKFPTIVTTSKLLTTGVDTKPVQIIALDTNIESAIEFKQIVGRGSRLCDEIKKEKFTILDFGQSTKHFEDRDFDGAPLQTYNSDLSKGEDIVPSDWEKTTKSEQKKEKQVKEKYIIDNIEVTVENFELILFDTTTNTSETIDVEDYLKREVQNRFGDMYSFVESYIGLGTRKEVERFISNNKALINLCLQKKDTYHLDLDDVEKVLNVAYNKPPYERKVKARLATNNLEKWLDTKEQVEVAIGVIMNYEEGSNVHFTFSDVLNSNYICGLNEYSEDEIHENVFNDHFNEIMETVYFKFHTFLR